MWLSITSIFLVYLFDSRASRIEYTLLPKASRFPQTFGFVRLNPLPRPLLYEFWPPLPNPLLDLLPCSLYLVRTPDVLSAIIII